METQPRRALEIFGADVRKAASIQWHLPQRLTLVPTTGGHTDAVPVTGNASIIVPDGSSFTVYLEAGAKIGGRGLFIGNAQPASCAIYGTRKRPGGQEIQIVGKGALK